MLTHHEGMIGSLMSTTEADAIFRLHVQRVANECIVQATITAEWELVLPLDPRLHAAQAAQVASMWDMVKLHGS